MSELSNFLSLISEGKKLYEDTDPKGKLSKKLRETAKGVEPQVGLGDLFKELASLKEELKTLEEPQLQVEPIKQPEVLVPVVEDMGTGQSDIDQYVKSDAFKQAKPIFTPPIKPDTSQVTVLGEKIKFLEQWISRIASAGPGSGEVNLRNLDDVDRSTIFDMRFLRYNEAKKKFEFAEVNPHDIVYNTHLVTTSTYAIDSDDYYVGVNYAGPTTITLPTTLLSSGRLIVIKDESGAAETNPITVVGNVDNDAGGFIIQINNGAIQLIYRNGWRII